MRYKCKYLIVTFVMLATSFLWGCGDSTTEESKPLVISKKISVEDRSASEATDDQAQKVEPANYSEKKENTVAGEKNATKRIYDPANRLNPFIPLFKPDQEKASVEQPNKSKRKKRAPQTPLERISIEQLQLRAVIRAASGNRALVEDNSGKGYIIKNGTYIGLNSGIVTQINDDSVIIEEEVENLMGELVLQNTEMKLQKQTGE